MSAKVYDPKKVSALLSGVPLTGWADGDMITVEPVTKENMKSHCGTDGFVSFTKVNDDRAMITLRLKPTSPSNIALEALLRSPALFPFGLINKSGGAYIGGATECAISEKPTVKFGAEEQMKEWKVIAADWSGLSVS